MAKNLNNKKRTTALPHRAMNKVSIWSLPQFLIMDEKFMGWRGCVTKTSEAGESTEIEVTSHVELGSKHGRMFMFANSIARKNDNRSATIKISDILEELNLSDRHENRKKIGILLEQCKGVNVTIRSGSAVDSFSLFSRVFYDTKTGIVSFTIDESYYEMMKFGYKERFIGMDVIMRIRESNWLSMELGAYLQIRGSGVASDGSELPAKKVYHDDILSYTHLMYYVKGDEERVMVIRRAFRQLEEKGYPHYKFITIDGEKFWTSDASSKPAKRYLVGDNLDD